MYFHCMFTEHRVYHRNKKRTFLLSSLCLLTILGFGIICYDDNLLDSNDPPVIALQYPIIIYPTHDGIAFIQLTSKSINLPLIHKNSFLTRAPPT
jgi:hypothetical protein